ncbi:protein FAM83C [Gadus morhua]|uniref:Family with sequence similarity 83 member C n=1 Tax=Gadus morhua TaxID=8049 RepID=A0A8C4Z0M1_GADMO|nr:protein FAM83C [Gadus morhua]
MISSENLRPAGNGRKPLGKLASRLEEVKNPWRQVATLELSHNEAARLATDALLEQGEKEYRRVLTEERELNFLSPLEIRYITEHATKACDDSNGTAGCNERDFGDGDALSELTSGTYFPMMSDEEPPMLELGWPESPLRYGPSETQIYFQRDKSHNVKDLVRSLINKATKVIALVMDVFTDVDLLCDLMEASSKRRVPVYILLDHNNLDAFSGACSALDLQSTHLSNMRVRSVCGDTYCTKSGRKFTGQVQEKFLIVDCEEVIAGSYSFTWLSAQVHSNMVMHFSGRIADSFDREFRCLYADSQVIECFSGPEDEGQPYYTYPVAAPPAGGPGGTGVGPGLDVFERQRERVCSENSSSQSSSSVSSVKASPGMSSSTVYKVTQGGDKVSPTPHAPERRGGSGERERGGGGGGLTPTLQNHGLQGTRTTTPNRVTNQSPLPERTTPGYGPPGGKDRLKSSPADYLRPNFNPNTSKFQSMGLYDHKPSAYHSAALPPGAGPASNAHSPPPTANDGRLIARRPSANPFLTKLTDLFLPPSGKDREPAAGRRPSREEAIPSWGGPDLSLPQPESQQSPPPPPPAVAGGGLNRSDGKRMTLGHSKLDLVNHYNKLKSKHVYSRFELKNGN